MTRYDYAANRVRRSSRMRRRRHTLRTIDGIFRTEVDVVPEKEDVDRPDLAAVVLLAVEMVVQIADDQICVEKLLRHIRGEHLFDDVVVFLVFKPHTGR